MRIHETRVVYRDEGSYCGPISMVKRLRGGDVLVVFREADWEGPERQTHGHPSTRTSLIRSSDEGNTWSDPIRPDPDGGNGTTINQMADGTVVISNFRWVFAPLERKRELQHLPAFREMGPLGMAMALEGVYLTRSLDEGRTWEGPCKVEVSGHDGYTTAGRVIDLDDGSWLMPMNGHVDGKADKYPWVARSTDRGQSWQYHGTCGRPPAGLGFSENRMLLLPDGRILCMVRTRDGNYWRAHSSDGGRNWSPIEETPLNCMGSSPADLLLLEDGRVLCAFGRRRPDPKGVRACLSGDGGTTWNVEDELILRDDAIGTDMGYPSTEQFPDGSLLTVHYWHNEDQIRHLVGARWRCEP